MATRKAIAIDTARAGRPAGLNERPVGSNERAPDKKAAKHAAEIIRLRVPAATQSLSEQVAAAVARLRTLDVQKPPGIAEAIAWVNALRLLGFETLDAEAAALTIGSALKYREDAELLDGTTGNRSYAWLVDA